MGLVEGMGIKEESLGEDGQGDPKVEWGYRS
jgi:hypothetical protein